MSYRVVVVGVAIIAVVNVALMIYAFARTKGRGPSVQDQVIGFLLAGPFFFLIDRSLKKRNHKLTAFEYYGLLALALTALVIIVVSIAANFSKYPS